MSFEFFQQSIRFRIVAALFMLAALSAFEAQAQILSPGDLAEGHAELEGLTNCTQCHEPGEKKSARRCLLCHKELAQSLDRGRGLHSQKSIRQKACFSCHPDHKGRTASLTKWKGPDHFEHKETGYPLTGGHAKAKCESCHMANRVGDAALAGRLRKRKLSTFLGMSKECSRCHFDEHRSQFGDKCERCHDTKAFKPTSAGFDHKKSAYPLQGAHAKVKCEQCHKLSPDNEVRKVTRTEPPKNPAAYVIYKPVGFAKCTDCHRDVHLGKFGDRCEDCHTVDGWGRTHTAKEDRRFHEKTRYPLRGKHVNAPCDSCHPKRRGKLKTRGLHFKRCMDCHIDAHFGQMPKDIKGPKGVNCERCHRVDGFYPTRYPLEDHQKTRLPLEASHLAVACNACHPVDEAQFASKIPPKLKDQQGHRRGDMLFNLTLIRRPDVRPNRCELCHKDPHQGQFSAAGKVRACSDCHSVEAFEETRFDHAKEANYPLLGPHKKAACASCHSPEESLMGAARYRGTPRSCVQCHGDVHGGQFESKAQASKADSCAPCHVDGDEHFKPSHFDHKTIGAEIFPLRGKHADAKCAACHQESGGAGSAIWYRGLPKRCDDCHKNVHPKLDRGALPGIAPSSPAKQRDSRLPRQEGTR